MLSMYRRFVKRVLDIIISLVLLVLFLPIWLLISLLIILDSPGFPLFKQERVGLKGKPFTLLKFRSMIPNAYNYGKGFYFDGEDDWRITRVGRYLRKTSLDEVPQLINVLIGDMSIVGPRPMLPYQYRYLSEYQRRRFSVRPGMTGLAQVSGRNILPWSKRIELDVEYVNSLSFWMDLEIITKTIIAAIRRQDISYSVSPEEVEDFIPKEERTREHQRASGNSQGS